MNSIISFNAPKIYRPHTQQIDIVKLKQLIQSYPIPIISKNNNKEQQQPFHYEYGTAGFRYNHKLLPPIMIRMGILASLRSSSLNGEGVGIMITASHNPENDNGVKLSDSNGGMMHPKWEIMATRIANATTELEVNQLIGELLQSFEIDDNKMMKNKMIVHVGRDTRSHSLLLSQLAIQAAVAMGATVIDHGCVTTPQLHYYVLRSNTQNLPNALLAMSSGLGFERDYMEGIIGTYLTLIGTKVANNTTTIRNAANVNKVGSSKRKMYVDCACGVGGMKIPILNQMLQQYIEEGGIIQSNNDIYHDKGLLELIPFNLPGQGPLNDQCGAEYVQKQQKVPTIHHSIMNLENDDTLQPSMDYVASLDGDADRIVFHCTDDKGNLVLLDGDKIAVLVSSFIQEELDSLATEVESAKSIRCGVVQTAYANGSSTSYLKNVVRTNVVVAKTGVKYVHAAAHSNYDVGTYFEANGHGTVLFSPKFYTLMAEAERSLLNSCPYKKATIAWQRLRLLPRLVNQAVGDALSDLFLVDAILFLRGWDLQDWKNVYHDLPSRQCKVRVVDRSLIQTNDNETKAINPPSLQPALENAMAALMKKTNEGIVGNQVQIRPRAFVRPSGTENVVRVYAEASTQQDADLLASEAAAIVYKLCNGVGDIPNYSTKQSNL